MSASESASPRPIRVLLVEPDAKDQYLLADLINHLQPAGGFSYDMVSSLPEALRQLARHAHDVVLAAHDLGTYSGLDLLSATAADARRPPVILLTEHSHPERDLAAIAAGAADYQIKDKLAAQTLERCIHFALERHRWQHELRSSEATLRGVLNDLQDALVVVDNEHQVQYANAAAAVLMARPVSELIGSQLDLGQVLQGNERNELLDARGNCHTVASRISETLWHAKSARVLQLADVTEQRAAQRQLLLLQRSVDASNDGVLIVDFRDTDAPVIYANPALERITGFSASEMVGRNCRLLQREDRAQPALDIVRKALRLRQSCTVVLRNYRKDGSLFWNRLTLSPVREPGGEVSHYIGILNDISAQVHLENERNYLATHDPITGLLKYTGTDDPLEPMLQQARADGQRLLVMYVDVDGLHAVNDSLGYSVGNAALRQIADRLRLLAQAWSPAHSAVLRHTGDEFLLLLGNLPEHADPLEVAHAVCACIAEAMPISVEVTLYLTCCVGASVYPDSASAALDLTRQADMATNRAKRAGRNSAFVFNQELQEELSDRLQLGGHLREALVNDEFVLEYQPQVNAQNGAIVAFEALVRWNSPKFGLLPPRRFVPVAEESGMIVQLGMHILRKACKQMRDWTQAGLSDFVVSVNVSAAQIQRPSFVADVRRVLEETELNPDLLEIEITESMLMENVESAVEKMRQLRALGIHLALDDFGMGYSSLSYLRRFPIGKLKIDQTFVQNVTSDGSDAALVRAMISMGHHLGMRVVAEGVETAAQSSYLRRNHCDQFQGFHYSSAVPASDVPALLQRRHLGTIAASMPAPEQTLLLLDDEENILRALTRLLRRDGYRILAASTATAAFEMLATHEVQVVLSDQRMPGISGTEFLSQVKEMYPETVRMVLSGYTDLNSVTEAINRGAIYKFLTKPWDDEALRTQVQEAFRRHDRNRDGAE